MHLSTQQREVFYRTMHPQRLPFTTMTKILQRTLLCVGLLLFGAGAMAQQTWYAYTSGGNWTTATTWTLDKSLTLQQPDGGGVPAATDSVVINVGKTVLVTTDDNDAASIVVDGTLDLNSTIDHNYNIINGRGTIIIRGSGTAPNRVSNFPTGSLAGRNNAFANASNGGTISFRGTADYEIDQALTARNFTVNTDAGVVISMGADLEASRNFTITRGDLRIGDGTTDARTLTVRNNLLLNPATANGARLSVANANVTHEINLFGDFTNSNGDVQTSQRTVQNVSSTTPNGWANLNLLSDTRNQNVRANGPTKLYRVVIDKGEDDTYEAIFTATTAGNFVLTGAANDNIDSDNQTAAQNSNAFALIAGTANIGTNIVINPLNNDDNYAISSKAKLLVNGGIVTKIGGAAIVPYGEVEVAGGRLRSALW